MFQNGVNRLFCINASLLSLFYTFLVVIFINPKGEPP